MIPENQLKPILEELLARSRQDKVRWATESLPTPTVLESAEAGYSVNISGIRLALLRNTSIIGPDRFVLIVTDDGGRQIHHNSIYDGDDAYPFYEELFAEANRRVTGWDKVLGTLKRSLESGEVIGVGRPDHPKAALTAG